MTAEEWLGAAPALEPTPASPPAVVRAPHLKEETRPMKATNLWRYGAAMMFVASVGVPASALPG
jgi:hypothetical protein